MNQSTIQPPSPTLPPPTDPADSPPGIELKYAVINAHTGKGHDWVAIVDLSRQYGVPLNPPEFWQIYRQKARGHETILLSAQTFYRAKIGGKQFGMYIDSDGQINYFTKKAFERELDRRYRDSLKDVDLRCDGDWSNDAFCRTIPEANLGESRFWLGPQ
jgi:hypothetical protein